VKQGRTAYRTAFMLHITEQTYAPGLKQARHAHSEMTITMILRGSLHECVGSIQEIARPLSIVIKPIDTEHADEFGARGARTLQIRIPATEFTVLRSWEPALTQWRWQHAPRATGSFLRLLEAHRTRPSDHADIESYAFEAIASLAPKLEMMAAVPTWLLRVREAIDDARHPARLHDLAHFADVHPVYLARQFRRAFSCSVNQYIQRRRIQKVAELTCDAAKSLSTAAYTAGFADHAHMCRVFRSHVSIAPRDMRRMLRA
jgi:AraC family transcriptional regulator